VLAGMTLAIWGNFLPKLMSPWSTAEEPFDWQRVRRSGGRLIGFAGLVVTLAWLTQTVETARLVSTVAVGAALATLIAIKVASRISHARRRREVAE
jgi:hypothetical protein